MTIPQAQQVTALPSQKSSPIVDPETGMASQNMRLWMEKVWAFMSGMSRLIPCNCSNVGNIYTLTVTSQGPFLDKYSDYDVFPFVASATSTGLVTGNVSIIVNGTTTPLATLSWYKTNGSAQATTGDIVLNSLYFAIYNDALNSGAGGLVIK